MTLFENFLEYCNDDNPKLKKNIETWLCDYFDLPNRKIHLIEDEENWINENLSKESQSRILGYTIEEFKEDLKEV